MAFKPITEEQYVICADIGRHRLGTTIAQFVSYDPTADRIMAGVKDCILRILHWKINELTESFTRGSFR
jgi:hypothetical protein